MRKKELQNPKGVFRDRKSNARNGYAESAQKTIDTSGFITTL